MSSNRGRSPCSNEEDRSQSRASSADKCRALSPEAWYEMEYKATPTYRQAVPLVLGQQYPSPGVTPRANVTDMISSIGFHQGPQAVPVPLVSEQEYLSPGVTPRANVTDMTTSIGFQQDPQAVPFVFGQEYSSPGVTPRAHVTDMTSSIGCQQDPQAVPLVFGQEYLSAEFTPTANATDVTNSTWVQHYVRVLRLLDGNYEFPTLQDAVANGYNQSSNQWPGAEAMGYDVSNIVVCAVVLAPTYANANHDDAEMSQPPQTQWAQNGDPMCSEWGPHTTWTSTDPVGAAPATRAMPTMEKAKPSTKPNTKKGKAGQGGQKRVKDEEVAQQLATPGLYVEHFWTLARLPSRDLKTGLLQQSCRNVQTAFETADPLTRGLMLAKLQGHILEAIRCPCANRVVERIIEKSPAASLTPLIAEIQTIIAMDPRILRHEHGCRLVQRLLEECEPGRISAIVDACLLEGVSLIVHEYGNHVSSCILRHGTNDNIEALTKTLIENVQEVARSEHGPSVLSAALASKSKIKNGPRIYRQGAHVEALANALVSRPELLVEMARGKKTGRHGHLAAQDAIKCASTNNKDEVVLQLMQYTTELRTPKNPGQPKDDLRYAKVFANFIDDEAIGYRFDSFGLDKFQGHVSTQGMSGPHGSLSMSSAPEVENDDGDDAVLSEAQWPHLTGPRPPTGAAITATVWA